MAASIRHVAGTPLHEPAQQSAVVVHAPPSATQAAVQTNGAFGAAPLRSQVPAQQSAAETHGEPVGRHAPGPRSQR